MAIAATPLMLFGLMLFSFVCQCWAGVSVERLRCEYLQDPLGIDVTKPRLSWILQSDERGQKQTAYQVLVAGSEAMLTADRGDLWDSGRVTSDKTVHIEYGGQSLESEQRCYWKVRVWEAQGRPSPWSPTALWSMGVLRVEDWQAKWIVAPKGKEPDTASANAEDRLTSLPLTRKSFRVDKPVRAASLHVASLGLHEVFLNGRRVGDHLLDPVQSDYRKRVYYVTHDVTGMLAAGENVVAAALGKGCWYCGGYPGVTLDQPALRLQLVLTLEDGSRVVVATDESWKTSPSPRSMLGGGHFGAFGGELYDARREQSGWSRAAFNDSAWQSAVAPNVPPLEISAQMMQPNRVIETYRPVAFKELGPGEYLVDVGRNLTGWFRMKFNERPGKEITLRYSASHYPGDDPLEEHFGQVDRYICGDNPGEFSSQFNWHSFQYVKLSGLSRKPSLDDMAALLVSTDTAPTSDFACSNELLNRLYQVVKRTHRCVTLGGIQVDCNHRERCGYGAEGQASLEETLYNFDSAAFYTKWARDFQDGQDPQTGMVQYTAPFRLICGGGPAWSGVCILFPWDVYCYCGDTRILEKHYDSMCRWLVCLEKLSEKGLLQPYAVPPEYGGNSDAAKWQFLGDWAAPRRESEGPPSNERPCHGHWASKLDNALFNNCHYYLQVSLVSKVARILGKASDAERYAAKAEAIKKAINRQYFDAEHGRYTPGEQQQPYLAFPLLLDIVPAEHRAKVLQNLVDDIVVARQGHLDFGVLGGYFTLASLIRENRSDLIYGMATQRTFPGWGELLQRGATTLWEHWLPGDSSIHNSYLSIGGWFLSGLAGIQPDPELPGFQRMIIKPQIVPGLGWVKAHYDTIRGRVASSWKVENGRLTLDITIPANSTATVFVPTTDPTAVTESGRPADHVPGVVLIDRIAGASVYRVASGRYEFVAPQTTSQ